MALPLPKVVADTGPGGKVLDTMSAINQYKSQVYNNKILQAQAQYEPYTQYANALSKISYANYLPYQIQAQTLSNPMLWQSLKDNPQALASMMGTFSNAMPKANSINGNTNLPVPGQQGQGILNQLLGKMGIGSSAQQQDSSQAQNPLGASSSPSGMNMQQGQASSNPFSEDFGANQAATGQVNNQESGSPLVPATRGNLQGVIGAKTAPFTQSPYKPGALIQDPNNPDQVISTPTEGTITASQNSINAAKRVEPQLERLANDAAPFMSLSGIAGNQIQRAWNLLFPDHAGDLPGKYARFQSTLQSAPEALVKAYGLRPTNETIERMQKVIEPYLGETKDQYKSRIKDQLKQIHDEQIMISSEQLSQGFPTSEKQGNVKLSPAAKNLAKDLELPSFKNDEEFNNWYHDQNSVVQEAVRHKLGKK